MVDRSSKWRSDEAERRQAKARRLREYKNRFDWTAVQGGRKWEGHGSPESVMERCQDVLLPTRSMRGPHKKVGRQPVYSPSLFCMVHS